MPALLSGPYWPPVRQPVHQMADTVTVNSRHICICIAGELFSTGQQSAWGRVLICHCPPQAFNCWQVHIHHLKASSDVQKQTQQADDIARVLYEQSHIPELCVCLCAAVLVVSQLVPAQFMAAVAAAAHASSACSTCDLGPNPHTSTCVQAGGVVSLKHVAHDQLPYRCTAGCVRPIGRCMLLSKHFALT
jgi:hypothetical protein